MSARRYFQVLEVIVKKCYMIVLIVLMALAGLDATAVSSAHGFYLPLRRTPGYSFVNQPQEVAQSNYDYFFSSYMGTPLRVVPTQNGGGYIFAYQARPIGGSIRRVYKGRVTADGTIHSDTNGAVNINEGFPTTIWDPETSTAFIAWHADQDGDGHLETMLDYYTLDGGIPSPIWTPMTVFDNPTELPSNQTLDNEFIWPELSIGPSPIANKRRIYIMGKNNISHTSSFSQNVLIAYADFDANDIAMGYPLNFEYTSIPLLDEWNTDPVNWRRTFYSFNTDANGRVIVAGMHTARDNQSETIVEEDLDYFINDNYGEGAWQRVSGYSHMDVWNPLIDGVPFITGNPIFKVTSSGAKFCLAMDNLGRIHHPGIWVLTAELTPEILWYPAMQYLKESIYDPQEGNISLNEEYPVSPNPNAPFTPWDAFPPWNEIDGYDQNGNPIVQTYWPFAHHDQSLHDSSMMFHYGYHRMTDANSLGMMVSVWQNVDVQDSIFTHPNINIAVSSDNGDNWSLPLKINSLNDPELANQIPMWVYPADQVRLMGYHNGRQLGRLGLLYFDDYTWGSYVLSPPAHPVIDGGRIMFTELDISFPNGTDLFGGLQLQIRDQNNVVIPWASVTLGDLTYTCNILGQLLIEELSIGTWDLAVTKYGYASFDDVIAIVEGQNLMQTVNLTPLAPVTLSGHVFGSDLPAQGLAGVFIMTIGSGEILAVTDENGFFIIPGQQPGAIYNFHFTKENYQTISRTGIVPETHADLGNIVMTELMAPPFHVSAEIVSESTVLVRWSDTPVEDKALIRRSTLARASTLERYVSGALVFLLSEQDINDESAWLLIHNEAVEADSIYFQDWHLLTAGNYYFAVKYVYNTGNSSMATLSNLLEKPLSLDDHVASAGITLRCYPNPAHSFVNIEISAVKSIPVSVEIFNIRGQIVKRFAEHSSPSSTHNLSWNGKDNANIRVSPGVYYIRVSSDKYRQTQKLLWLK